MRLPNSSDNSHKKALSKKLYVVAEILVVTPFLFHR